MKKLPAYVFFISLLFGFVPAVFAQTTPETRSITFPVIGTVNYGDDFGDPREGGKRTHEGNDLLGKQMMPLVAAVDGRISRVAYPEASYGYSVTIEDKDGYTYHYLHINNDTPGTDDGKGGGMNAYAVDIDDGNEVVAGQLIGWMGDSGNAEGTTSHLHFEIRRPDRTPISPYNSLKAAKKITAAVAGPKLSNELLPFDQFGGGSFIAMGNVDSDSQAEIAIGAGPGGGPHVRVLNQDGTQVAGIFPYATTFRGGVDVALGDVDGDGIAEIITAPYSRGGPHVKIFKMDGTEVGGFMAYDSKFQGGVNIAAADMDNDGKAEIITAPGKGGGPHVRIFKPDGTEVFAFFAYDQSFRAGIDVAAYSKSGNSPIIATIPNNGGGPHVKVFDKQGVVQSEFMAYDAAHLGGARISLGDVETNDPGAEVITVPLFGGSHVRMFAVDGDNLDNEWGFEEWWTGSWDVASYLGTTYISSGPNTRRRASVREVDFDGGRRDRDR